MNDAAAFKMASAGTIATRDRQLVVLWAVAVLLVYAAFGYFAVRTLEDYAVETRAIRASMVVSPTVGAVTPRPGGLRVAGGRAGRRCWSARG